MQFKQYPSYKDSGVEWLGEVPEHWDLKRFKYILEELNERSELGDETLLSVSEYYGVKPRKETIDEGDILSRAESLSGYKKCKSGDLVMNIMLAWKRGLGITKFDGIVSPAYAVFRLFSHNYSEDYIHYLLRTDTYTNYFKSFSTGVMDSRLRLYPEYFGNLTNISPSLKEQNQIVSFLDTETARIDNLIAKQEKLIELLEEQRKSIISHAVTKGLDPNAPMKDSGVEWLGEVPEHWKESKIKFVSDLINEKTSEKTNVIALENIESWTGKYIETESTFDSDAVKTKENDVLFGKLRPYLAKVYLTENQGEAIGDIYVLRPNKLINPKLLKFFMLSERFIDYVNSSTNGTKMPRANWDFIGSISIYLPEISIQNQIVNHIEIATVKIESIINKQTLLIENLKEYRSSIISHAVTGKIDVREYAE